MMILAKPKQPKQSHNCSKDYCSTKSLSLYHQSFYTSTSRQIIRHRRPIRQALDSNKRLASRNKTPLIGRLKIYLQDETILTMSVPRPTREAHFKQ